MPQPAAEKQVFIMRYHYTPPDFAALENNLRNRCEVSDAAFLAAPAAGILPERFYTSTNHPTYVRLSGRWRAVQHQRRDCAIIFEQTSGELVCIEPQWIGCGTPVLVGWAPLAEHETAWQKPISENGEEGIYVDTAGFKHDPAISVDCTAEIAHYDGNGSAPATINYAAIAELIEEQHQTGASLTVWVVGPAVAHPQGRSAMQWLIAHGYVGAVFGGNELALWDLAKALMGTPLDRTIATARHQQLAVCNKMRQIGSIQAAITDGLIQDGILYACHTHNVPIILAGSLRDACPLPDVITDTLSAQRMMQEYTARATLTLMIDELPLAIATQRMLPSYIECAGTIAPVSGIAVNSNPLSLTQLTSDSAHQMLGVLACAEDFLSKLVAALQAWQRDRQLYKRLDLAQTMQVPRASAALELAARCHSKRRGAA
jgi:hypothetical protein